MNRYLLTLILAATAASAFAQDNTLLPPIEKAQATIQTVESTNTVRGIDISTSVPTDIILSTTAGFRAVQVYNVDTSSISCGESPNLSTTTGRTDTGFPVPTGNVYGNPWTFPVRPGTRFYCMGQSVTRAVRAVINRLR